MTKIPLFVCFHKYTVYSVGLPYTPLKICMIFGNIIRPFLRGCPILVSFRSFSIPAAKALHWWFPDGWDLFSTQSEVEVCQLTAFNSYISWSWTSSVPNPWVSQVCLRFIPLPLCLGLTGKYHPWRAKFWLVILQSFSETSNDDFYCQHERRGDFA